MVGTNDKLVTTRSIARPKMIVGEGVEVGTGIIGHVSPFCEEPCSNLPLVFIIR